MDHDYHHDHDEAVDNYDYGHDDVMIMMVMVTTDKKNASTIYFII